MRRNTVARLAAGCAVWLVFGCSVVEEAARRSGVSIRTPTAARDVVGAIESAKDEKVFHDSVKAGLVTRERLDAVPYGYRVSWIHWDSGFRGSGLEIGDRILAVNGERYTLANRKTMQGKGIGDYAEPQYWESKGITDGREVTLTVKRHTEILEITGRVRADRQYYGDQHKRLLGPGGPPALANDGFRQAWSTWYDEQIRFGSRVLDGGWQSRSFGSRKLLRQHLEGRERLDYLVEHYPGPFTAAVAADWERVRVSLEGKKYTLTEKDLEYRGLEERQRQAVADAGRRARESFLAEHGDEIIDAFPAVDPIEGDTASVVNKLVVLPTITPRQWVMEGDRCYMTAGGYGKGYYFAACEAPMMQKVLEGWLRYQKHVSTKIDQKFDLIGRVRDQPKMLVVGSSAVTGLSIDVVAATIDDKMFVDVSAATNGVAKFAGEDAILNTGDLVVPPDASPAQVVTTMIEAVKVGNEPVWRSLFAPWRAVSMGSGPQSRVKYYPQYYTAPLYTRPWLSSRRLILGEVYDARVVRVGEVGTLLEGDEFEGAPHLEEVVVEIEHVGLFDGEYRGFVSVAVHRLWTLQRRDGGPWRITEPQAL